MSKILFVDATGFASPAIVYKNKAMIRPGVSYMQGVVSREIIIDLDDDETFNKLIGEYYSLHTDMLETLKKAAVSNSPCVTEQDPIPYHMLDRLAVFTVEYCKVYGKDEKLRQLLFKLNGGRDGLGFLSYAVYVDSKDEEIKQAIINLKDESLALDYCLALGEDEDMAKVILDSGQTNYMLLYYRDVEEDSRMRKGIADSEQIEVLADYCEIFDYDKEMTDLLDKLKKEKAYLVSKLLRKRA